MLTTLLSLYIFSSLQTQPAETASAPFIKSIGSNITDFIEKKSPIKKPELIAPVIEAEGSIAIDIETGTILYAKNENKRLAIASITKLMTTLIIIEENKLDEVVTVSKNATGTEGSQMQLKPGEEITVENLLYGSMIHSANDAAIALAEYNAGTVSNFVDKMNNRAVELGLINTHFANPIGLDSSQNYSSALDIAKLAQFIYHNKFIKKAAKIKELEVKSASGKYTHKLTTTNDLLNSYLKIKGLKTGQTREAGLCLVSIAENEKGNEIITIVLNSPARFQETKILVDWVFRAYNWN